MDCLLAYLIKNEGVSDQGVERDRRAAEQSGSRLDQALNRLDIASDEASVTGWSSVTGLPIAAISELPARNLVV